MEELNHAKLLEWIESRDFGSLLDTEKETVLAEMTEAEYGEMRNLYRKASAGLSQVPEGLKLPPGLGAQIFAKSQKAKPTTLRSLFSRKIPVWQAAAAAVLFAATFYLWGAAPKSIDSQISNTSFVVDTLKGISLKEDSALSIFLVESL